MRSFKPQTDLKTIHGHREKFTQPSPANKLYFYLMNILRAPGARYLLVVSVLLALLARPALAQKLDLNANSMSDVWEQIFRWNRGPGAKFV